MVSEESLINAKDLVPGPHQHVFCALTVQWRCVKTRLLPCFTFLTVCVDILVSVSGVTLPPERHWRTSHRQMLPSQWPEGSEGEAVRGVHEG